MATFLRTCGHLIQCKIIAPESIHFVRSMHEPILNDPEACAQLDILGGHFYGWDGSAYPLAAQKGKEVWMTEYLINERQNNLGLDINWVDDGFLFARSINDAMLANMSAWVHYSLKRFYGCIGDGTYGTVNGEITKRGYVLSQYAKYVTGTTRVRHILNDPANSLSVSAYETARADSLVMMVINPAAESYDLTLTLPFNTLGYRMIATTETVNVAKTDMTLDAETNTPAIEIEPYSVNTLIFAKSSALSGTTNPDIAGTTVFTDNFALYGASCVPDGWRVTWDEGIRYAGEYTLGPRIMSFSPEGLMPYAFYFRSSASSAANITYGQEDNMRLHLEPATYTLEYSVVGWKGTPEVTASVRRSGSRTAVATDKVTPQTFVEANGPSERITAPTNRAVTFDISVEGDYDLRWSLSVSSGGFNEALVGNIMLTRHDDSGVHSVVIDTDDDGALYDLMGRRVTNPLPGLYIRHGQKVWITE